MTIALLADVPPLEQSQAAETDVATFGTIYDSVRELLAQCIANAEMDGVESGVVQTNESASRGSEDGRVDLGFAHSSGWVKVVSCDIFSFSEETANELVMVVESCFGRAGG